jgi:hypothetical protein
MRAGRRPLFFLIVSIVCFLLIPANVAEFRWVNVFAGSLAALWAILLWIEVLAGRGRGERSAGL